MKLAALFILVVCISPIAFAHGISPEDQQRMIEGGASVFIPLGATHMLTGYDHLLFLFGVIFFLTTFRAIAKFVTAFTLGHSITLILATFLKINANYFLIDAVIGLSVCYIGFNNVDGFKKYLDVKAPSLLKAVFLLGLIHGFGLSTRLQQLPLGDSGLLLKIIYFNVGIELGQILALAVMVVLISRWRKTESFSQFSMISSNGLILAGLLLFVMQMHGFLHTDDPDSFGFATDTHSHTHAEMYVQSNPSSASPSPGGLEAALGALDGEDTTPDTGADGATEPDFDNPQKPWVRPSSPD